MLNDAKIKAAKKAEKPYKLADAEQLYLYVNTAGGRLWRMNYSYGKNAKGKPIQKTLSFGAYPAVSLLDARAKRDEAKKLLRDGRDPAVERRIVAKVRVSESENTFESVARRWYALKKPSWAPIHAKDVMISLERDAFPFIGDLPITAIKAPKLLEVLQRVEVRGSIETAHRLRQRCSAIFVYGIAAGACDSDPAASIGKALQNVPKTKPQPSIIDGCKDYATRIAAVRKLLIDCEEERCRASTKLAMRLIALTAVRPNELRGARWDEFEDLDGPEPQWRIPAARMKGDKERKADPDGDHLVPLARQSLELLAVMRELTGHLPYAEVIRRYDGPETLFYLDPPYWGCERDYGEGVFDRGDFERMAAQLAAIAGRFILSLNATPGAREVFAAFHQVDVETTYTISTASGGSGKRVGELLISNWAISP